MRNSLAAIESIESSSTTMRCLETKGQSSVMPLRGSSLVRIPLATIPQKASRSNLY